VLDSGIPCKGAVTYSHNIAVFHQPWKLLALGASAPELPGSFIGGNINGAEGQFVALRIVSIREVAVMMCDDPGSGNVEVEG
jgi:hypothetical protein